MNVFIDKARTAKAYTNTAMLVSDAHPLILRRGESRGEYRRVAQHISSLVKFTRGRAESATMWVRRSATR